VCRSSYDLRDRMKILLVVHGFPPLAMGGTEIYTHELAVALAGTHEVSVLAREADPQRPEYAVRQLADDNLTIFLVNNTFHRCRSFAETYRSPTIRTIAADLIDRIRPDVVHIHHLTCLSTEIVLEVAQRQIPMVATLHDFWLLCHRGQLLTPELEICGGPESGCDRCIGGPAASGGPGLYRLASLLRRLTAALPAPLARVAKRFKSRLARLLPATAAAESEGQRRRDHMLAVTSRFDRLLALSETVRERFIRFGVPRSRAILWQLGIDHRPFCGSEGPERRPGSCLRIGFLGSLMVSKAPHLLIEAFARLPVGSATLDLYGDHASYHGDDHYRARLQPLLELPGVTHRGAIPHSQVPQALASLDVVVMSSIWLENSPLVIREAFLAGIPVVAADQGGMAEMVQHETNGLLFKPGDVADLSRCLFRLTEEPGLLDRLRAGIPAVKSIETDAEQLIALFQELIDSSVQERQPSPRLAAAVLNYNTPGDTLLAVRSLQSSRRPVDDLIVVDNGSESSSYAFLESRLKGVDLVRTGANLGFSGGCNVAIRRALERGAELVLLLNSDAMVAADTIGRLEQTLANEPGAGIAGPLVLAQSEPSTVATAGIRFHRLSGRMRHIAAGTPSHRRQEEPERRVAAVAGCVMLIRRQVLEQVGLLDEELFFFFEDLDFCLRAATAGYATISVADAIAYHQGSASISPDSPQRLYYAARNHLLAARRAAPVKRFWSIVRSALIVGYNLAHALLQSGVSRPLAVSAVLHGVNDYLSGHFGAAPGTDDRQATPDLE
jgi:GT2 family glycosyltransferase/glycosyltransferase involved in cell wall biosynthesis